MLRDQKVVGFIRTTTRVADPCDLVVSFVFEQGVGRTKLFLMAKGRTQTQ